MNRTLKIRALAFAVLASAPLVVNHTASAASQSTNLAVSANVVGTCSITISATLNFGTYDKTLPANDAMGMVIVTCPEGVPLTVTMGQGAHDNSGTSATPARRMMSTTDATSFLPYNIYMDGGRTSIWGDTSGPNFRSD